MRVRSFISAVLMILACSCLAVRAQDEFPTRMITLVVPLTPGTTIDILARLYADKLLEVLGPADRGDEPPGAGGIIGGGGGHQCER